MARYVHAKSRRAKAPFISVNCAAIPENLLESELFGHEKGAFTGAVARRVGKFEEANGGTLLLDEISEMDARLQAKLLRAIQEREIDRVGGSKPVKVDIRILATSNRDLAQAVKDGTFREDLLYRLNVVNLRLPPLRERPGDVITLCEHFVKKYSAANGVAEKPISAEAKRRLIAHRWPGNVRELENAMHRAVLLSPGAEIEEFAIRLPDGQPLAPAPDTAGGPRRPDGGRRRVAHLRRLDGGRGRADPDHRHPGALPGQPHPCGQHPGHLDPHPAQQAEGIRRRRRLGAAAAGRRGRRLRRNPVRAPRPSVRRPTWLISIKTLATSRKSLHRES
jgi:DNA-binding NtrC family response regulator